MKVFKVFGFITILNYILILTCSLLFLDGPIPLHVNIYGQVDSYGANWMASLLAILPVVLWICMIIYKRVMKKNKKIDQNEKVENKILPAILLMFCAISWLSLILALYNNTQIFVCCIISILGLLMTYMGNYMGTVKPNRFLGIRIPWTLDNEEVWKKTHRMSSYLSVIAGLILIFAGIMYSFYINTVLVVICIVLALIFLIVIPTLYSYVEYKKITK